MNEPLLAKWLRWLVYASALIPLVIFSQYMSPFHFGKVVVFRSMVQVMAALYLLLIWRDATYRPKGHPILWAFLSFAIAFTVTSMTSVAFLQSFWGTLERMGGLFTFWHYFVFYMIAVSVMRTRSDWRVLLDIMVVVGVISAIYGFLQKTNWTFILGSGGRQRPFGTIGNAALFAGYQIVVAFLALTLSFMQRTTASWKKWYWIAGGVMLLAVLSTAVRGSLIGIAVGALVGVLLWSTLNRSRRAKNALLAGLVSLVLFVFLAILLRSTSFVQDSPYLRRITDFSSNTFTVQTRFWAWSAGFQGWAENPKTMLVGWGPENFNVPFSKHFNPKFFTGPGAETFFDRAHNMFIEVLVTMGLVGLLAYLSIFVTSFRTYIQFMKVQGDTRVLGIGFSAMTIAYMIHNAFIFDTSANFLTFFMLLAFVTHVSFRGIEASNRQQLLTSKPQSGRRAAWSGLQLTSAAALGVVVLIAVYTTNIRPTVANYASTRAIVAGWQGDWARTVTKYREAIDADTFGRYDFRHRFAQYLLEASGSPDIGKITNFNEVMLQAVEDIRKNTIENPQDYLSYLYISRLYIVLGKNDPTSKYNDLALEMCNTALKISPTFVRTYYEVAQIYINKKEFATAVEWFQKAAALNPEVGLTYWYIGSVQYQIALRDNSLEGVREALKSVDIALKKGYSLSQSDGTKLVQAYFQLKDFGNMAMVLERLVKTFPTSIDNWGQLIAVYGELDNAEKAIDAIRRALAVPEVAANADFRAKAEITLRNLGATP